MVSLSSPKLELALKSFDMLLAPDFERARQMSRQVLKCIGHDCTLVPAKGGKHFHQRIDQSFIHARFQHEQLRGDRQDIHVLDRFAKHM